MSTITYGRPLAASAVLASVLVLAVWLLRPGESLAHEVVTHVQGEPNSWFAAEHVSAARAALREAGATHATNATQHAATAQWLTLALGTLDSELSRERYTRALERSALPIALAH